jgi:cell division septation protein DedD
MVFGVIVWVALAVIIPTMVVPTIQHAVAPSSVSAAPDTQPQDASDAPRVVNAPLPG